MEEQPKEKALKIGSRNIGGNEPCMLIAEVGQAHEGSLGIAHSYIDAAAKAGVDAIKFQTHIADAESTLDEVFRIPFSYEDATRFDYWERMEFTPEQWRGLSEHAREKGLVFMSTPFSVAAAQVLDELVPAWKIGSGDVGNIQPMEYLTKTGKPVILSSGMSSWADLDAAVRYFQTRQSPLAVLQCTTQYPVELTSVGINVIAQIRERYHVPCGLSDHSGTIFPALMAMAQGAALVEFHMVFHKGMFGPDTPASLIPEEIASVVEARNAFQKLRTPVDKDKKAAELAELKALFGRSIALAEDLPAGTVLRPEHLVMKKPAGGLPADSIRQVVGARLKVDVSARRLLLMEQLEFDSE